MPWFYVDDGFSDSKPVLNMPDRYRLAACGLWVLGGSWSAKEELDGFVPDSKLKQLGARPPIIAALTDLGQLSASLCTQVEGGIQFNSWEKWQKTRAELIEKRHQDAERQRKWREEHPDEKPARKSKGRNAVTRVNTDLSQRDTDASHSVTNSVTNGVTPALVTRDTSRARARGPDPTRPDPTLTSGNQGGGTHLSNATSPPPRYCPDHIPDGPAPGETCGGCADARRAHDTWTATAAIAAKRIAQEQARAEIATRHEAANDRTQAVADCELCNKDGYLPSGRVCDHIDHEAETRDARAEARAALRKDPA